jgi:peptidyl-prolyl cis-trans isomerase D
MLDVLLKRTGSIVFKGLMALLVLSFAIWGIGDVLQPRASARAVATVGSVNIQPNEFVAAYQREIQRLQGMFGNALDREQARSLGIPSSVLSNLVQTSLFNQEAQSVGVVISDALIRQQIAANGAFRNSAGQFDPTIYQATLRQAGMSEQDLVTRLRSDLSRAHLLDAIEGAESLPKTFVEPLYRYMQEKRVAETIRITDDSMPEPAAPSEDELVAYHKDNAPVFTAPEYRKLSFISLTAEDIAKSIDIPDDKLRQAFDDRRGEFDIAEKRQVQHMLLPDEATAKKASDLLAQGRSFADVAKETINADASTLDLGTVTKEELATQLPEAAQAAFSVKEGENTQPVKSPIGWHLLHVTKVETGHESSFEEVKDKLRETLARERALDDLYDLANKVEDVLGSGATLEETASKLSIKLKTVEAIDAEGKDPAGNAVKDIPDSPRFLQTAFETAEQTESIMTDAGDNGYFLLRVDGVTPPALKPLASIHDQVVTAWKNQKRGEAAKAAADKALERVKAGEAPAAVAASIKAKETTTEPFLRQLSDPSDDLPQALASALFRIKQGEATIARGANSYYVAKLKDVIVADPAADSQGVAALSQQLADEFKNDLRSEFAGGLQGRFPVSVNGPVLEPLIQ